MGMFDVFVEGPTGTSPDAAQRLAEVMSQRYGLPAAELVSRMAKGRFRVKGNIDETTANTYARDLEAIGARVTIAASRGSQPSISPNIVHRPTSSPSTAPASVGAAARPTPLPASSLPPGKSQPMPSSPLPPGRSQPMPSSPLPPRTGAPSLPPAPVLPPRTGAPSLAPTSVLPPRTGAPSLAPASVLPPANAARTGATTPPFASGLSAAFSGESPAGGLGALELGEEGLSLAPLDGEEKPKVAVSFSPSSPSLPASIGPASAGKPAPKSKAERPKDVPLDLFAPPDAESAAFKVELEPDEARDRKRMTTPPATRLTPSSGAATPMLQRKATTGPTPYVPKTRLDTVGSFDGTPRWRFAAGVILAVLIGFLPAHLVAEMREDSAFEKIDTFVAEVQAKAHLPDAAVPYDQLDTFRAAQESRKESERRTIAMMALVIWAAAAGVCAYVWFKRIPWDRRA